MSDILTLPTPKTEADYEACVRQLFAEMDRLEEQVDRDRAESERLKRQGERISASIDTKLAFLDELVSSMSRGK